MFDNPSPLKASVETDVPAIVIQEICLLQPTACSTLLYKGNPKKFSNVVQTEALAEKYSPQHA